MTVDIHTHILPDIDDGAEDLTEALNIIKALKAQGVTDVVLTPHFYFRNQDFDAFLEKRNAKYAELKSVCPTGITLHLGAESEFSNVSINYDFFRGLAIDNGGYILLELPFLDDYTKGILQKIERLKYQTGLTPIIAHAERYQSIRKHPCFLSYLVDLGCLIQVNAESVLNLKKGSLIDAMFNHRLVHLLGSDCHNTTTRKPLYAAACKKIEDCYGRNMIDSLNDFGTRVIENQQIQVFSETKVKRIFGKYY